ncbi:MAG: hypothetical protein COA86_08610 [Kangiella sp.]|nr:MAG: hypothetical protein COA86_08610 [Kangiella sp.]
MDSRIKSISFFLLVSLLLASCKTVSSEKSSVKSDLTNAKPCWFETPSDENRTGIIGAANGIFDGIKKPYIKSRKNAYLAFSNYLNINPDNESEISENTTSIALGNHTIYFLDEYYKDSVVYSYAQLDNATFDKKLCKTSSCIIAKCSPTWLCELNNTPKVNVLGVSYLTYLPSKQQNVAIRNALVTAKYLYGVDVDAAISFYTAKSNNQQINILKEKSAINASADKEIPAYLVTNQCSSEGVLFARVRFNIDNSVSQKFNDSSPQWITNPKYNGIDGAVGNTDRRVVSGLFSGQIKLAIKRAIVQLALEQESNIKEEFLTIEYESGGSLIIRSIDESVQINLKVKVIGLHVTADEENELKVFAWVSKV